MVPIDTRSTNIWTTIPLSSTGMQVLPLVFVGVLISLISFSRHSKTKLTCTSDGNGITQIEVLTRWIELFYAQTKFSLLNLIAPCLHWIFSMPDCGLVNAIEIKFLVGLSFFSSIIESLILGFSLSKLSHCPEYPDLDVSDRGQVAVGEWYTGEASEMQGGCCTCVIRKGKHWVRVHVR